MFDQLIDVIGNSVRIGDIVFTPILGFHSFSEPTSFLTDHWTDLPRIEEEYDIDDENCWWTRARILSVFGIDHPVGRNLSRILDVLFAAVWFSNDRPFPCFVPLLLTDVRRGDYGPTSAALAFASGTTAEVREHISQAFWSLLLKDRTSIGVFKDYYAVGWHECDGDIDTSSEGAVYAVSCNGIRLDVEYLGSLNPEFTPEELEEFDRSEAWDANIPFELPRKQRNRSRGSRRLRN